MKTKTVYSYSRATGEYVGDDIAFESPRDPGIFLLPACSTETPPPEVDGAHYPMFTGEKWEIMEVEKTAIPESVVLDNPILSTPEQSNIPEN